ncbi:MAG: protein translocase subunit SecD [Actinomycetota bacterium]|nr:protein translocase subunit SecD [Actinomycetota bacterium]
MKRTRGLWLSVIFVGLLVVGSLVGLLGGSLSPTLGLDLEGGVSVILKAPDGTSPDTMEQARANIDRRVNALGVAEPDISVQGTNIEVQLPGLAKGTIEQRPKAQSCIEAADRTSYGCFPTRAAADTAFGSLDVQEQTQQVCITGENADQIFPCFTGETAQKDAKTARDAITVQEQTSGETTGQFCLQDPSGAQFGCFPTKDAAGKAKAGLSTEATTAFCVTGDTGASLPCFPTKDEATSLKDGLKVVDETTEYCVVSSDQKNLGCFLDPEKAQVELQRTGQGELLRIIGTTARLEEREVLSSVAPGDPNYAQLQVTCDNDPATTDIPDCPAKPDELAGQTVVFLGEDGTKYQLSEVKLEGDRIKSARAVYRAPSQGNVTAGWVVDFTLTGEGATEFGDLTTALVGRQLAIVLDATVISAPTIQGPITGGTGQITGNFTEDRAKSLAAVLQAGALPVELERQQVQSVSPTLGKESLDQGIKAAVVGLVALLLYLLFYYRLLGVVAWFGMSIWAILAIALVSLAGDWFGYSLTLAGVAGLVISLGVTADSYIVFFERLKDEVRHGRSPRAAVQPAFKRAYKTIVAADIVTALAAAILYVTAVSQVRGFALTLGVATALDLFVVWFFKRPTVFLIARNERLVKLRGFGLTSGVAGDPELAEGAPLPVQGAAR